MTESRVTCEQLKTVFRELPDGAIACLSFEPLARPLLTMDLDASVPSLRVVVPEELLERVREDFYFASRVRDRIEIDQITLRATPGRPPDSRIVTDDRVLVLAAAGDERCVLQTTNAAFVEAALDQATTTWNEAREISLSTPGFTRLQDTSRKRFGPAFERDFSRMLTATDQPGVDRDLDVVEGCLLLGAKHEELFYDIASWGEDVGIASKATFTRRKTHLTDQDLIGSEAVPVAVGRPRHRLILRSENCPGKSHPVVRAILTSEPE